jgi:hypothetical protein
MAGLMIRHRRQHRQMRAGRPLLRLIQHLFQILSARLKFAEGSDERGTHTFSRALQAFPFRLQLGFEIHQFLQFFND